MEKIKAKNFFIAEICFRIIGKLYNHDYIVMSADTYNFVGHLANDIILGKYSNSEYEIFYYLGNEKVQIANFKFDIDKEFLMNHELIKVCGTDVEFEILSFFILFINLLFQY